MSHLKITSLSISILGMLAALPAGATPVSYGTPLSNPGTTIDFSDAPVGADVSTRYAGQGVTFSGLYASNAVGTLASSTPPAAANYTNGTAAATTWGISFSIPISDATFFLYTDFGASIASTLAGAAVETVSAGQYAQNGQDYFGFVSSKFDAITVTMSGNSLNDYSATLDNLSFTAAATPVPEPGSIAVLLAGLGGLALVRRRV